MSIAAPARPMARPRIVQDRPLRYPEATSASVMRRRGWWLVLLNFLIPGSAQSLAGNRKLGRFGLGATLALWTAVVVGIVVWLLWRPVVLTALTNSFVLLVVQVLLIGYAVLWLILTLDTLRLVRLVKVPSPSRWFIAVVAVVLLILGTGGTAYAAHLTGITRNTLGTIFGAGGPAVAPSDGYYNILMLGADPDKGRDSMRPDSISVISINATTGAVTITGLPRDMQNVPFADGPMHDLFPDGYRGGQCQTAHCGLNEIYTEVTALRDGTALYPTAESRGSDPGIEALKQAAEGIMGIEVPYFVLIDMHGFAALIDALGGVDITVTERLPEGGGPKYDGQPAEEWATGWIEVGPQHMDGETAMWYARSRYTTSDWDRMKRQRELQRAMLDQFTPTNVLARFQEVASAGSHVVETDVPQSMLGYFSDLALKSRGHEVESIELTPEGGVDPDNPDFGFIREEIQSALHPPSPSPTP